MLSVIASRDRPQQLGARAELKQHLAQIAELQERLQPFIEAQQQRGELRAEEERVNAALERLDEEEKQAWDTYANSGGERPRNRVAERHNLEIDLRNATEARANFDRRTGAAHESAAIELQQRIASLAGDTPTFVDAVLTEIANELVTQYEQQLREIFVVENALLGLREAAQVRNRGNLFSKINDLLRRGRDDVRLMHDGVRAVRARWRALADRLDSDPDAFEELP